MLPRGLVSAAPPPALAGLSISSGAAQTADVNWMSFGRRRRLAYQLFDFGLAGLGFALLAYLAAVHYSLTTRL